MYTEYSTNSSGGKWWLDDDDWRKLESAGWEVDWMASQETGPLGGPPVERWLGALAMRAIRRGSSLSQAINEFEQVTGQWAAEPGCSCCGQPHHFIEYSDSGQWINSGPNVDYGDEE